MKIHITKQGETIEGVASKYAVSNQDLIGINPHINLASDLVPGLKLKIPDIARTEKTNEHIEKFYPNLEYEQNSKEQSVPIGLKPFSTPPRYPETTAASTQYTPEYQAPWSHLNEQTAPLNTEPQPQHPWNPHHATFNPYDTRLFIPPYLSPYPAYPYPYAYPPYGYGFPLPFPGFGYGGWFGGGHHHGGHFGHFGHHHHGGHFGHHHHR